MIASTWRPMKPASTGSYSEEVTGLRFGMDHLDYISFVNQLIKC